MKNLETIGWIILSVTVFIAIATVSISVALKGLKEEILRELKNARILKFLEKENLDGKGLLEFNEKTAKKYLELVKSNKDASDLLFPDFKNDSFSERQITGYEIAETYCDKVVVTVTILEGVKITERYTIRFINRFISGIELST